MSTILFDDAKFATIYETMRRQGQDYACCFRYPDGWDAYGGMDGTLRAFVQDLCRANTVAFNERYEDENEPLRLPDLTCHRPYPHKIALFKSLGSISYNIDDSDVCECVEMLRRVRGFLASEIISALPEYEQADVWVD